MNMFIKKYQYNFIRKMVKELTGSLVMCVDSDMIKVSKALINKRIQSKFDVLDDAQIQIINVDGIYNKWDAQKFMEKIESYVEGMPRVTKAQVRRLFRKEKKLKVPDLDNMDFSSLTYLGWRDKGSNNLYVVYFMEDELVGMVCRGLSKNFNKINGCALCGRTGTSEKVAFVSVVKKKRDNYESLGFYLCTDSKKCNDTITDVLKLEELIRRTVM